MTGGSESCHPFVFKDHRITGSQDHRKGRKEEGKKGRKEFCILGIVRFGCNDRELNFGDVRFGSAQQPIRISLM